MKLLPKSFLYFFTIFSLLTLYSGAALIIIHFFLEKPADAFSILKHPYEKLILKIHIFVVPWLTFCLGYLTMAHAIPSLDKTIKQYLRLRKTGVLLIVFIPFMIISGYLLQILNNGLIEDITSYFHWIIALLFTVVLMIHLLQVKKRRKKYFALIFILFLFVLFIAKISALDSNSISKSSSTLLYTQKKAWVLMGTLLTVEISGDKKEDVEKAIELCWQEINTMDQQMSIYKPNSDLSRINATAYNQVEVIHPNLQEILSIALKIHKESSGLFNINTALLSKKWGFYDRIFKVIPEVERVAIIKDIQDSIQLTSNTIHFTSPFAALDLGGIAKGYALDKAILKIKPMVSCANINLGGQIYYLKNKDTCETVTYLIQNPYQNSPFLKIQLERSASISTSGNYEYFLIEGKNKKHGHILNPLTGLPSQKGGSVTIIKFANDIHTATFADAWSTALFLSNEELKIKIADSNFIVIDIFQEKGSITNYKEYGVSSFLKTSRY